MRVEATRTAIESWLSRWAEPAVDLGFELAVLPLKRPR